MKETYERTVRRFGEIEIPYDIRRFLRIVDGDIIQFRINENGHCELVKIGEDGIKNNNDSHCVNCGEPIANGETVCKQCECDIGVNR